MPDPGQVAVAMPGSGQVTQFVQQLKDSGRATELVVAGRPPLMVADATSYQLLLDLIDRLEMLEDIQIASRELEEGEGLSIEQAKDHARRKYGIPV